MEKTLTIRVAEGDLVAWKEAAWSERLSLSEWVRRRLTAGVRGEVADPDGLVSRPAPAVSRGLGAGEAVASPGDGHGVVAGSRTGTVASPAPAPSSFRPDPKVKK